MLSVLRNLVAAAAVALIPATSQAVVNSGFETGDLTGWDTSGDVGVFACAIYVVGCAPDGGTFRAELNPNTKDGNASLRQTLADLGPGTYEFGAWVSFGTDDAAGNFNQGQISLTAQGAGMSETVGYDPNALNSQFTIAGASGFSFTDWFLLSGTLVYSGPGTADFLLNINVQDFNPDLGIVLLVDNAFIKPIPIPAALPLFMGGLLMLGGVARRRAAAKRV